MYITFFSFLFSEREEKKYSSPNGSKHYPDLFCLYYELLTFRGPCIVIYSCNKSQQNAIFLNFILVKNSTCFGQIYCPTSGVLILYSEQ